MLKSFTNTKRKLQNYWEATEENRVTIEFQKETNNFLITEISDTESTNQTFSRILDLTTNWGNLSIVNFTVDEGGDEIQEIFQSWKITLINISLIQLVGLNYSFDFKFASEEYDIQSDTNVQFLNYIDTNEEDDNIYNIFYGVFIQNTDGLLEINEYGIQARLNLRLINPNVYF